MNKKSILSLVLAVLFVFSACGSTDLAESESSSTEQSKTESEQPISTAGSSDMFTDKDMEIGYNEERSHYLEIMLPVIRIQCRFRAVQLRLQMQVPISCPVRWKME